MPDETATMLEISIVTPTYNRRESLRATLLGLVTQSISPARFEVLVISDGSTDGTAELCHTLSVPFALRFFEQHHEGPAAARNLGVREARAPWILFLDDDVVPDMGLVAEHLRLLAEDPTSVVIGPLLVPPEARLQPWVTWEGVRLAEQYDAMTRGRWQPTPSQFYTGNASVARAAVLAVGGFDAAFLRAEDVELAYRLRDHGARFVFAPEARGWHYARRSFRAWLRAPWLYGDADARMSQAHARAEILQRARAAYWSRPWIVRALARLCAGRPWLRSCLVGPCGVAAIGAGALPGKVGQTLSGAALSIIFNIGYFDGLAERIGPGRLWTFVEQRCAAEELLIAR